jgi:hypothetical protein
VNPAIPAFSRRVMSLFTSRGRYAAMRYPLKWWMIPLRSQFYVDYAQNQPAEHRSRSVGAFVIE